MSVVGFQNIEGVLHHSDFEETLPGGPHSPTSRRPFWRNREGVGFPSIEYDKVGPGGPPGDREDADKVGPRGPTEDREDAGC